ncbi:MAG: hypothetical protein HC857_02600 [Synechococcales cyanobacterium RU_4_20]|nr:hypothetical protein [Synechococcales cyanobacterium RU_4_20]NJR69213.1 hypothetical protein [Synechococcales cyanobacterium CRU_2_2]
MRLLSQIFGIALLLVGLYYLGQNIIFTTQTAPYWWRDLPAAGSVLSLIFGTLVLMFGRGDIATAIEVRTP